MRKHLYVQQAKDVMNNIDISKENIKNNFFKASNYQLFIRGPAFKLYLFTNLENMASSNKL